MKSFYNIHSFERLNERVGDEFKEKVLEILDERRYISFDIRPSTSKVSKLFYLSLRDEFFVGVQDEINKEVVTLMPEEWHRDKITPFSLKRARRVAMAPKVFDLNSLADLKKQDPNRKLAVTIQVRYPRARESVILKHDVSILLKEIRNTDNVAADKKFRHLVLDETRAAVQRGVRIECVSVKVGNLPSVPVDWLL